MSSDFITGFPLTLFIFQGINLPHDSDLRHLLPHFPSTPAESYGLNPKYFSFSLAKAVKLCSFVCLNLNVFSQTVRPFLPPPLRRTAPPLPRRGDNGAGRRGLFHLPRWNVANGPVSFRHREDAEARQTWGTVGALSRQRVSLDHLKIRRALEGSGVVSSTLCLSCEGSLRTFAPPLRHMYQPLQIIQRVFY